MSLICGIWKGTIHNLLHMYNIWKHLIQIHDKMTGSGDEQHVITQYDEHSLSYLVKHMDSYNLGTLDSTFISLGTNSYYHFTI